MKILLVIFLCMSFSYSKDDEENIVKTSELELFLFKVGFQSLLKDVDYTKDRSIENENEISELNKKVRVIMDEVYKEKQIITIESSPNNIVNSSSELIKLKQQIDILTKQMKFLLENKDKTKVTEVKKTQAINTKNKILIAKINKEEVNLRAEANNYSKIVGVLKKRDIVKIDFCNSHGWCKLKDQESFVAKFLLYFDTN